MNISQLFEKTKEKEFTVFPSTLETYAWYKPILVGIITVIVAMILSMVILAILHIDPKGSTIMQLIYAAITMITVIPALFIGNKLIYKIPFSSQVAPIREWNWGIYIKSFVITLLIYLIFVSLQFSISGASIQSSPSIAVILLCLILPLFQGFAEEFLCRGLLMQSFGSWFKIPIVAIIIQAVIFGFLHPYQVFALLSVILTGIMYGLITWYAQGLEFSSAMHGVNNILSFLAIALGLQQGATSNSLMTLVMNFILIAIPIIIVLVLEKKFNLFGLES